MRYEDIAGWRIDDHAAALRAFLASCRRLTSAELPADRGGTSLREACQNALAHAGHPASRRPKSRRQARLFFEHAFAPHRIIHDGSAGLLTGYYEPVLAGSRVRTATFGVPVYRRPPDLETVVADTLRGAPGIGFTHMRRTSQGLEPYATRAEIEAGALAGQALELVWLADPVDAFFLQVQGSGLIRLTDGAQMRISYDGKNGHPYSSIGRYLIDQGVIGAESMTLQRLADYLRADVARGRGVMQRNASFVFFRELAGEEGATAQGALGIPLTPLRSLAVDASVTALGLPVWVEAPSLRHAVRGRRSGFRRLMIAHDVGSAIQGAERGDIYFGSGNDAGALAGVTKHPAHFIVLVRRSTATAQSGHAPEAKASAR